MQNNMSLRTVWTNPIHFLAFGFGVGTIPVMPGTFGTLIAIPFYLIIQPLGWANYAIIVAIAFFLGIWLCGKTAQDLGHHDYPGIVWDEIVGFFCTMFFVPAHWYWIVAGFVLFRIMDIWKPWPIFWVDKHVHGGFGIMLDDLLAALYAWLLLQIVIIFG
jgi:phosphatidylglycerophosphatase A